MTDSPPTGATLAEAEREIALYFRERMRQFHLQQVCPETIEIDIEDMVDLFMPKSGVEFDEWVRQHMDAQLDLDPSAEVFRDFSVNHADALASEQVFGDQLKRAAMREVDARFDGWRDVVVGVHPRRGIRLVHLAHPRDEPD